MRADRRTAWYSLLVRIAPTIVLATVLFLPRMATAAPSISLDPDTGPPGAEVTVSGDGFPGGALVTIMWDGLVPLNIAGADGNGSFTAEVSVPALTSEGSHTVTATALTQSASARFTVRAEGNTSNVTTTTSSSTTTSSTTSTTTTTPTTTTTSTTPSHNSTTTTTTPPHDSITTTTRPAVGEPSTDTTTDTGTGAPGSTVPGGDGDGAPPTTTRSGDDGATPSTAAEGTPGPPATTDPSTTISTAGADGEEPEPELVRWAGADLGGRPVIGTAGEDLPHLAGLSLAPGRLSVDPSAAKTGAYVDISLDMEVPTGGFFTVVLLLDGAPLGDPVPLDGSRTTVTRVVPMMTPGSYTMAATASDLVIAQTRFDVLASSAGSNPLERLLLGVVVAALIALGWQTARLLTSQAYRPRSARGRNQATTRQNDPDPR